MLQVARARDGVNHTICYAYQKCSREEALLVGGAGHGRNEYECCTMVLVRLEERLPLFIISSTFMVSP